jgi:hypothetical protein
MKTSDQVDKIFPAVLRVQQMLPTLKRDKQVTVKHQSGASHTFKFAPLDSIMESLKPCLDKAELGVMQAVDTDCLVTRIIHSSGQWIESETFLNRQQANMQQFGAEITYKRRYALSAMLGIVTDDDGDVPRISATKGVIDQLPEQRQSAIIDSAEYIKDQMESDNEWGGYETYVSFDGDERIALWGLLPSKVRSVLTKMHKDEIEKQRKPA